MEREERNARNFADWAWNSLKLGAYLNILFCWKAQSKILLSNFVLSSSNGAAPMGTFLEMTLLLSIIWTILMKHSCSYEDCCCLLSCCSCEFCKLALELLLTPFMLQVPSGFYGMAKMGTISWLLILQQQRNKVVTLSQTHQVTNCNWQISLLRLSLESHGPHRANNPRFDVVLLYWLHTHFSIMKRGWKSLMRVVKNSCVVEHNLHDGESCTTWPRKIGESGTLVKILVTWKCSWYRIWAEIWPHYKCNWKSNSNSMRGHEYGTFLNVWESREQVLLLVATTCALLL